PGKGDLHMNDKDLGKKLLDLDAATLSGVPDARQQTWAIVARDRRRVRLLTILALLVCLLAALLVFGGLAGWYAAPFQSAAHMAHEREAGKLAPAQRDDDQRVLLLGLQKGTLLLAFSVAVLAIFSLCAVILIVASRRATLRQVNATLVEIAEQLRQLR